MRQSNLLIFGRKRAFDLSASKEGFIKFCCATSAAGNEVRRTHLYNTIILDLFIRFNKHIDISVYTALVNTHDASGDSPVSIVFLLLRIHSNRDRMTASTHGIRAHRVIVRSGERTV